jgi:phosphohistidine phosphatase
MRHADARWKDAALSDLERPLNRRGTSAAETMARRLLELKFVPDLILVSPARRTQQTGEIIARELSLPSRSVLREEGLYLAAAPDTLVIAQRTGPRVTHLMLIAHNPGLSELLRLLVPRGKSKALGTAALCSLTFDCSEWGGICAAAVTDVHCESPPTGLFGLFA